MGARLKPITTETFQQTVIEHNHSWLFLNEQTYGRDRQVFCQCGLCGAKHWVGWVHIKTGRSKRCRHCMKLPDLKAFNKKLQESGNRWVVQDLWKIVGKSRRYFCECTGCGGKKWIDWATLQQMKTNSCRSCSNRKRYGSDVCQNPTERELFEHWKKIQKSKPKTHFKNFEHFKTWALRKKYRLGMTLSRKQPALAYGPHNTQIIADCYTEYVDSLLPVGRSTIVKL